MREHDELLLTGRLEGRPFDAGDLLRAGFALAAVMPIAFASPMFSIVMMELVDNAVVLAVPGALEAGLSTLRFWRSLSFALAIAFVAAVPVTAGSSPAAMATRP